MRNITTEELDELTVLLDAVFYHAALAYPRRKSPLRKLLQEQYHEWIKQLHRCYKLAVRPHAWPEVVEVLSAALCQLQYYFPSKEVAVITEELKECKAHARERSLQILTLANAKTEWLRSEKTLRTELNAAQQRIRELQMEITRMQTIVETRPKSAVIIKPAQQIEVKGEAEQKILYLMGAKGLARKWRLEILAQDLTQASVGTIRNSFTHLQNAGLLTPYTYKGEIVKYRYGNGSRSLFVLTEDGRFWYSHAFSADPLPSELEKLVSKHKGIQHAVDILEVRDLLRERRFIIDDQPAPLLMTEDQWGPRSEPDLILRDKDGNWPIEVQCEVDARNNAKWEKSLDLSKGRLILILETDTSCEYQKQILQEAAMELPNGTVLLTSLETLRRESGKIVWQQVTTGFDTAEI